MNCVAHIYIYIYTHAYVCIWPEYIDIAENCGLHIYTYFWACLGFPEKKHQLQHMSSHAHVEKVNAHLVVLRCIHRLNQNRTWAAHNVASPCCFGFLFGTPSPQARGHGGNGGKWHMRRTTFPVWGVPFYLWLIHRGHEQTARRGPYRGAAARDGDLFTPACSIGKEACMMLARILRTLK